MTPLHNFRKIKQQVTKKIKALSASGGNTVARHLMKKL
jgi:hypothetical protein